MPDLKLQLLDSLGHSKDLLLECGFICLKIGKLLGKSLGLCFLIWVMSIDFLDNSMKLISQGFASVLALHCQHRFEGFLLWSKDLDLFLMDVEILGQLSACLSKIRYLSLQIGCVISWLIHTHNW